MLRELLTQFPKAKSLFIGWKFVPTTLGDTSAPPVKVEFDENMKAALDKLENHLEDFASDDELGLYLETKLRPIQGMPGNKTTDKTAGIP